MTTPTTRRLAADAVERLWAEYRESGDPRIRDRLVLTLAPMVKYIVYRKVREIPARCEIEDFIASGLEALLGAIDRYEPERGASLPQFAWTRIHGAVLDELRRNDWAPRSVRQRERLIRHAGERFLAANSRIPTDDELAQAAGISRDELDNNRRDTDRSTIGSLNVTVDGEDDPTAELIDTLRSHDPLKQPELAILRDQAGARLREAVGRLSERERKVARLLYVDSLTLREIGEILGVTESRVSQIHSQLRERLRDLLAADKPLLDEAAGG
jgi:RNA polymerase sigma factor for flagellar operon FliA